MWPDPTNLAFVDVVFLNFVFVDSEFEINDSFLIGRTRDRLGAAKQSIVLSILRFDRSDAPIDVSQTVATAIRHVHQLPDLAFRKHLVANDGDVPNRRSQPFANLVVNFQSGLLTREFL